MAHKFPPWRRIILVPFWTVQLLLMIIIIGLLATSTALLHKYYDKDADYDVPNDADLDAAVNNLTKM